MSQEYETLQIRRKITPDPSNRNTRNLDIMQSNLKIAAETIEALRQERDRIKVSVKSINDQASLHDSHSKSTEEAEELKKFLHIKDKKIEKLEKQVRSFKLQQIDTQSLVDNCEKLKKELIAKEKHIISLEKIIRDLKNDLVSQTISSENSEVSLINQNLIEKLHKEISELRNEKNNWLKVHKTASSLNQKLASSKDFNEKKSEKWEIVLQTLENLQSEIVKKEEEIQELAMKNPKEKLNSLKEYNKSLKNELENLRRKTLKPGLLFELTELCTHFIQVVHSNQSLYFLFKKNFTSSKSLKDLIESSSHSEALLKLLKFSIEIIQTQFIQPETPEEDSDSFQYFQSQTPKNRVIWKHEPVLETRKRFFSPCTSAQGFYQPGYRLVNSPGQTYHNTQIPSPRQTQPGKTDRIVGSDTSNKSQQTSVDAKIQPGVFSKTFNENIAKEKRDLNGERERNERVGLGVCPEADSDVFDGNEDKKDDKGFIQIFDESEQLLNIIDKQNSRLARIGNQISQLVPEKIESVDEPSSESSDDDKRKKYHYLVTYPNQSEFQEGTFGRKVSSKNPEISENSKSSQIKSDRENYIKILGRSDNEKNDYYSVPDLTDPSKGPESQYFQSCVERTTIEHELKKSDAERQNFFFDKEAKSEDFTNFSQRSNPRVSGKRSDLYQEIRPNNSEFRKNLKSPQENLKPDRNPSEYWNSVADYFSQKDDSN